MLTYVPIKSTIKIGRRGIHMKDTIKLMILRKKLNKVNRDYSKQLIAQHTELNKDINKVSNKIKEIDERIKSLEESLPGSDEEKVEVKNKIETLKEVKGEISPILEEFKSMKKSLVAEMINKDIEIK